MNTTDQIAIASLVASIANVGLWFYTIKRDSYKLEATCSVFLSENLGADARCLELKIKNRGTRSAKIGGITMLHGKDKVTHELIRPDVSFVCQPIDNEDGRLKTDKLVVAGKEISIRDLVAGRIDLPAVVINPGDTFTKKYLPTDQEDYFVWSENGIRASDLWIEDSLERRYHVKGAKKALREYFRME